MQAGSYIVIPAHRWPEAGTTLLYVYCYAQCDLNKMSVSVQWFPVNNLTADLQLQAAQVHGCGQASTPAQVCGEKCKIAEL